MNSRRSSLTSSRPPIPLQSPSHGPLFHSSHRATVPCFTRSLVSLQSPSHGPLFHSSHRVTVPCFTTIPTADRRGLGARSERSHRKSRREASLDTLDQPQARGVCRRHVPRFFFAKYAALHIDLVGSDEAGEDGCLKLVVAELRQVLCRRCLVTTCEKYLWPCCGYRHSVVSPRSIVSQQSVTSQNNRQSIVNQPSVNGQ